MKLNQFQKNVLRFIGFRISTIGINILLKTVRMKIKNNTALNSLITDKKNFVIAFWHGSMMIGWYLHRYQNIAALVSKSKDGDLLANVLTKWNYNVVRGSSHIGGQDALIVMIELANENNSIIITPDGPTGPVHKMKAGAVVTAKKTGLPLFLIGIGIKKKFVLKSWDGFEIPKPFAKATVIYSDPILIDDNLNYEQTNQKLIECENQLNKLQKDALLLC